MHSSKRFEIAGGLSCERRQAERPNLCVLRTRDVLAFNWLSSVLGYDSR
jgi:hypothetical protein